MIHTSQETDEQPPVLLSHKWVALGVLALCVSLIVIDGTIVNVSLPVIMSSLNLSATQAAWVTTIYALLFSAFLIAAGRFADRIGRKTLLAIGVLIFIVASLLASVAHGANTLLAARALQGLGGALIMPCTLSTVNASFFGHDRRIAFAVWGSVIAGMAAIGPLAGGWLTTYTSWRWIFIINLPIGLLLLLGIILYVPQTRDTTRVQGSDIVGFFLSSIGLASCVFGLMQGREYGWIQGIGKYESWPLSPSFLALIGGMAFILTFWTWESRRVHTQRPVLLDTTLFNISSFTWGNIAALVVAMGEFGLLFVLPLHLQNVMGLSALQAGGILVAMAVGALISGSIAAFLSQKIGAPRVATLGLALEVIALTLAAIFLSPQTRSWEIAVFLAVYGLGLGLASAQLTSVILVDVPSEKSGQGSATQSTTRQIGTAMGIAVISTIFASSLASGAQGKLSGIDGLPDRAATAIEEAVSPSLGRIVERLKSPNAPSNRTELSDTATQEVISRINEVSTHSSKIAIGTAAGILGIGALATLKLPRNKKTSHR